MRRLNLFKILLGLGVLFSCLGFSKQKFDIDNFDKYEKEFVAEEIDGCFNIAAKTYMPYQAITNINSKQYKHIKNHMTIDSTTGMLYDEDGFIGVALASKFGAIGDRYYFTLEDGKVLPLVKIDEKADDTTNGCTAFDGHLIEFVIDPSISGEYFGQKNGYVNNGNFNNDDRFKGVVVKFEKVTDKKLEKNDVIYIDSMEDINDKAADVDLGYELFGGY